MRHLLNTLFVLTEESYLSLDGENVVVLDGEVSRSKIPDENVPIWYDFLSDEINIRRFERDMSLITSIPDFHYHGEVTAILSDRFMTELIPFSQKIHLTDKQRICARLFYERTADMWKKYYPECFLFYVEADHWSYLHTQESIQPIVTYLRSLIR